MKSIDNWAIMLSQSIWGKQVDWTIYESQALHQAFSEDHDNSGYFCEILNMLKCRRKKGKYTKLGYLKKRK